MLNNALSLLVYWTLRRETKHPNAPVVFFHKAGQDVYSIVVQRMPEQEAAVG